MRWFTGSRGTSWFSLLAAASLGFLAFTWLSYALAGHGALSRGLFWIGLGGENNLGAWWAGMLFLLPAAFALDGYCDGAKPVTERRGWAALGAALLLLSFDETASLHEHLGALGVWHLAPLGALGGAVTVYSLVLLRRARLPIAGLLAAFALLAVVPLQEYLQLTREWTDPFFYGLRAFVEEGTEIVAALIFVAVTSKNCSAREPFAALVRLRAPLLAAAAVALPFATAVVASEYRNPAGPASWLAASLFFACALLAVRRGAAERRVGWRIACYVAASAASNAVSPTWDPAVLGQAMSLRGLTFAVLTAALLPAMGHGRLSRTPWGALAAGAFAAALVWPSARLLWSAWPAALALLCYFAESRAAAAGTTTRRRSAKPAVSVLDGPDSEDAPDRMRAARTAAPPSLEPRDHFAAL
jgi:hypothetical protein